MDKNIENINNDQLLRGVYKKFDSDGIGLTFNQTVKMLARLSRHFPELKKVEYRQTIAIFALVDRDGDGRISFEELREWWKSQNKYELFVGQKALIVKEAYEMYCSYAKGLNMSKEEFYRFLDDNKIVHTEYAFDAIHKDSDRLTFSEFIEWLNWL